MKFLIVFKKSEFKKDTINPSLLSCMAPSLISNDYVKMEYENFDVYIYTYNQILDEENGSFYEFNDDCLNLFNGLIAIESDDNRIRVKEIFKAINENELIIGDYQAVHLDTAGNGYIKTPHASVFPLFHYEDECCSVVSNEIKLIVDGVNSFEGPFIDHYDVDYMYEMYDHGYFHKGKRHDQRATAFKDIRKVLPQDSITFSNNSVEITENDSIEIPEWFEKWYLEDRESLYDWYYDTLLKYSDSFLSSISDSVTDINMGLSGGFDSRLSVLILEKQTKRHGINLNTFSTGDSNHPDVAIAKRISELLNLNWRNAPYSPQGTLKKTPQHIKEYASTFFVAQGDFDSHDSIVAYTRKVRTTTILTQIGVNLYKRDSDTAIINHNRWFSRRIMSLNNFFFPLFGTDLEIYFALIFNKHYPKENQYKEFVYNVLKRGNPELLEIPFAFDSLPQVDVEEYKSEGYNTTLHRLEPFLWDYDFVLTELGPVLEGLYNEKDTENDSILSQSNINPLDYFLLKKDIEKKLKKYSKKDFNRIRDELNRLKDNSFYPQCRIYLEVDLDEKYYLKKRSLMKLMDYASAARFLSFDELSRYFLSASYDSTEEIYRKLDELARKNDELNNDNTNLKNDLREVMSSNSWKITKPLRKIRNK